MIRKRMHRGGYVSFYAPGRVIHFSPEEYADRSNTARRLRLFAVDAAVNTHHNAPSITKSTDHETQARRP